MAKKKRRKQVRKSTAKKSPKSGTPILSSLNRAFEDASRQAFKETLAGLPGSTLVGKFLDQLSSSPYFDHLRSLSLDELAAAVRRGSPSAGAKTAPARKPAAKANKAARKRGPGKKFNTRTLKGRARLDRMVAGAVEKAGTASAEEVRASVGGTAAQVRESLARQTKSGQIERSGQRRATRYSWKG